MDILLECVSIFIIGNQSWLWAEVNLYRHSGLYDPVSNMFYCLVMGLRMGISHCKRLDYMLTYFKRNETWKNIQLNVVRQL